MAQSHNFLMRFHCLLSNKKPSRSVQASPTQKRKTFFVMVLLGRFASYCRKIAVSRAWCDTISPLVIMVLLMVSITPSGVLFLLATPSRIKNLVVCLRICTDTYECHIVVRYCNKQAHVKRKHAPQLDQGS